jgi:hypothetical protein
MKRIGLLVGALALALGSGVAARSPEPSQPEPPPWIGGRVELPAGGFAITLPDDWVGLDPTADALRQRDAASSFLDPIHWSLDDDELWVEGLANHASQGYRLWTGHMTSGGSCGVGFWGLHESLSDVAHDFFEFYSLSLDARDAVLPRPVELPAGPAYLIRWAEREESGSDEWLPASTYLFGSDGAIFQAYCRTEGDRPADDWLSIVETIEILPVEPPPWIGGRVEMPIEGFAVTLPNDWVGLDTLADVHQLQTASRFLHPAVWPTDWTWWADRLAGYTSDGSQLISAHATSASACRFGEWASSGTPLRDEADSLAEWYLDNPLARDVEPLQLVDLPAGPAYVVRMLQRSEPDTDVWWPSSHYVLRGDGFFVEAYCWSGDARPEDDWLSIVETIEILPLMALEPPPWVGGRVEMPEHGFAVTLPDEWVGFDTAVDAARQLRLAARLLERSVWSSDDAWWVDDLASQASRGVPLVSEHATIDSRCELGPSTLGMSFYDAAEYHYDWYRDSPTTQDVKPGFVDLPVGTAYHIGMVYQDGADPEVWWPASHYVLGTGTTPLEVYCHGTDARAQDDWPSIVEALELLPLEESAPIDD